MIDENMLRTDSVRYMTEQVKQLSGTNELHATAQMLSTTGRLAVMFDCDRWLLPQSDIAAEGGIVFEWRNGDGCLAMVVAPDGSWLVWGQNADGSRVFAEQGEHWRPVSPESLTMGRSMLNQVNDLRRTNMESYLQTLSEHMGLYGSHG